ncbi:hypothetical protein LX32DRAFT_463563 [Colletotrichum zoysiae]|uniref:Uncharacterized protein n=1 Tax=Colletotrichum zoysiae TaxID=1216348 RepID=A0AAD9HFB2_9PEZI|nr:hypothetical protein LX32DRAFT_463563 [Colletotrichum zoysiae]
MRVCGCLSLSHSLSCLVLFRRKTEKEKKRVYTLRRCCAHVHKVPGAGRKRNENASATDGARNNAGEKKKMKMKMNKKKKKKKKMMMMMAVYCSRVDLV